MDVLALLLMAAGLIFIAAAVLIRRAERIIHRRFQIQMVEVDHQPDDAEAHMIKNIKSVQVIHPLYDWKVEGWF